MDRITEVEIAGKKYPLNYSVKVMQILQERFGDVTSVARALLPSRDEGEKASIFDGAVFDNVIFAAALMMEYGAKYRKLIDGVDCEALKADELEVVMNQHDYINLYTAVLDAMNRANTRKIETEEDPKNVVATQD